MSKVIINSFEDFQQYVGQELGTSDYVELTQERINMFADATLDHQWIHVDIEKAKAESPFGQTIAELLLLFFTELFSLTVAELSFAYFSFKKSKNSFNPGLGLKASLLPRPSLISFNSKSVISL